MRKNNRQNNQDRRGDSKISRRNDPIVIININWEDLLHKNDDEIRSLNDRLNKNLRLARTKKDEKSSKIIEKEICYIQREIYHREKRIVTHEKFSRK